MYKLGLKLWPINENYIKEATRLYERGIFNYVELFIVPDTYDKYSSLWAELNMPYIIHAPHYDKGVNLSRRESLTSNLIRAEETIKYADRLNADIIIFHPGIEGTVEETVYQLDHIKDSRIVIENKPYYGYNDVICVGSSPEDIEFIMTNAQVGFCLDIGHAICSANARKMAPLEYLKDFSELKPNMYHLTDGLFNSVYDRHEHFGKGNYNIKNILSLLPTGSLMTIETDKDSLENLNDFEQDIIYLNSMQDNVRTRE